MKKASWLWIGIFLVLLLVGCSDDTDTGAEQESEKGQEEVQTEKEEAPERTIPEAAIHNVEEITKEKGQYNAQELTEEDQGEIRKELEALPDGLTGEEAYSIAVSLFAADIEEEARKFEEVDPTIQIDSSTPEDEIEIPEQETVNVAILLDASGSMAGEVSGGAKMKLAKQAIQQYASGLPGGSNVMLRVYGHEGTGTEEAKEMSCKSNEVVYELAPYEEREFTSALEQFDPAGWTPLAGAIQAAEQDLKEQAGEHIRNVIYVVSDGIETCGGDPVAAAASLSDSDIEAEVNIIGFDVDNDGQKQLEAVAKAGRGQYKSVYSESELNDYLKQEYSRLYWEWLDWGNDRYFDILDQSNDIVFGLIELHNDITFKILAAKNEMNSLQYDLKELDKFKDEEAVKRYLELIGIRHDTVKQNYDQEKERKDSIRKETKAALEQKVKETREEKQNTYQP
ncbi:VWA domain-containing protein [Planococcus ruber]|uniref:VWA domain-containing protein n=1 Tax=Planococcus ruber TaxID=2027871 RepID=UPI001FEFBD67|nr:VWA domain-containing protein [Planococcus ruber]MCJ1910086.1 VWA domain-containing protein [Planococcus ruber]